MTLAIDFGTSNTVVTRWNSALQQPELLRLPDLTWQVGSNPPQIPSLIYVEDAVQGKVTIGQAVRDRGLDTAHSQRFFRNFKRGIGVPIQGFMPELDGRPLSFEQLGTWFLTQLIQAIQAQEAAPLDSLILTVPVDSFEAYRHWLGQLCTELAVEQVRMLDEPTAAALGYGLTGDQTLLVIDFGGGTLDFSLVQLTGAADRKPLGFVLKWGQKSMADRTNQRVKTAQVLAKSGENLGGADIDSWLADYFQAHQGLPISPLTLRLAEQLKIQLSERPAATEAYFDDETLESYELQLDRAQFQQILQQRGLFERLEAQLTQVLQQARSQGVSKADIDAVLLVGGTAKIPAVQQWVKNAFESERVRCEQPFSAIAQGALQLQQIELQDFLYHGYGIRFWDRRNHCHGWHPIIQPGQAYPMATPINLVLGASVDNQPSIELIVGELGNDSSRTEVFFEGNRLITKRSSDGPTAVQPLNDREGARSIAQLQPLGFPGNDRIQVSFRIDSNRFLRITVEDLLTGQTLMNSRPVVQLS
ncbi:MAG: Hsp70 family protein [Leptolyngbya sp. SIO4C1]|nr:Hsp70 family protein [Leptolyngbya sp. SIO4C1]